VDDRPIAFGLEPGVGTVVVTAATPAATRTRLVIEYVPLDIHCEATPSAAEGEPFHAVVSGAAIETCEDRAGVLAGWNRPDPNRIEGVIGRNLLAPFSGYGRLGQLAFSRRTLFFGCAADGIRFWLPVDLAVLPRHEATASENAPGEDGAARCRIQLRNNTGSPLKGTATLRAAQGEYRLAVDVPARSEQAVEATIPADHVGLLSPGDNAAELVLPGTAGSLDLVLPCTRTFEQPESPPTRAVRAGLIPLPLDEKAMIPDSEWITLRVCPAYPHMPWNGSRPPLESLEKQEAIACPDLPLVDFALPRRKFIPVSFKAGRPAYVLDLKSRSLRKLYVLVIPFFDNHDMFAPVARVTVRSTEEVVYSRTLRFPGDLDWWFPPRVVSEFATVSQKRPDRFGLLPLLPASKSDWEEGRPPLFPQPRFWSSSRHLETPSAVMSIVEIDLGRPLELASLTLEAIGVDPSLGLVAVTGLGPGGQDLLEGTRWNPPTRFREPRTVFSFQQDSGPAGWRLEGGAFSVGTVPSLFMTPTLNSLGAAGESATGRAISPDFSIRPGDATLAVQMQGGQSRADVGPGLLAVDLVDSADGRRLHRLVPAASHALRWATIDVHEWAGRTVHLEVTDQNSDPSYAWIGLAAVRLSSEGAR
jgi:hypothetical protein